MIILVTGGAGYIGSHVCIDLLQAGHEIVVVDNLCNSSYESLARVMEISGKDLAFHKLDLLDEKSIDEIFRKYSIEAVIHFAGLKSVIESEEEPLKYYNNNITGTINLLKILKIHNVKNIVYSSSANIYGEPQKLPITEDFPLSPTNPYGRTKLIIENILRDIYNSDPSMRIMILRYFNPVGAHKSGKIGESPNNIPNNLLPYIAMVSAGKLPFLSVYGNDYPTNDGTGVRDYIHISDLSNGHICALNKLFEKHGIFTYNLGTGKGYSVLEIIKAFEKASGKNIPYKIKARRPGDIAESFANPAKANKELEWIASLGIDEMCEDAWRWQLKNPDGY